MVATGPNPDHGAMEPTNPDNPSRPENQVPGPGTDPPTPEPEPADPDPTDPDPAGSDPAGSDPAGSDPAGSDPAGSDPADPDPAGSDPAGPDRTDPAPAAPLRRPVDGRMLGGVAAGVARTLRVDVSIVRLVFVALALLGGSGILIYGAAWVLVPEDDDEQPLAARWLDGRDPTPTRRNRVVRAVLVALGIVVVLAIASSGWGWWGWGWGRGLASLVLVALAVGLVLSLFRGGRGSAASRLGRLVLAAFAVLFALVALTVGAAFGAEALTGVPLHGGIGDNRWRPTSPAMVDRHYQLAIGNLVVDLGAVRYAPGSTHTVTATVGMGHVVVEVPRGTTDNVSAPAGVGDVSVFGHDTGGVGTVRTTVAGHGGSRAPALTVQAQAGLGQVQVVRAGLSGWAGGSPADTA